jgi:RNA recognition motif-containing protein
MSTPENKTMFLGDLSRFCTEIDLEELFRQYGEVLDIKISRTSTGISLGYGFITMAERSQAEVAMEKLRGAVLSGRPIRIDWAARNVRDNNSYASTNEMINSIHVRYDTLQVRILTKYLIFFVRYRAN